MAHGTTIAICNQKGGVGKTTTCANLGIGLVRQGKKVLVIDADAQGSLTASLGFREPDKLPVTLATVMKKIIDEETADQKEGIVTHPEGVHLLPANRALSDTELSLVNASAIRREEVLSQYINSVKHEYDFVLVDCMPSLGMMTLNALAAADSVIIPVQAQYLPAKGLEQLLLTISKVQRNINKSLSIAGILLTMVDARTNYAKEIITLVKGTYHRKINFFSYDIPMSVRAAETSAAGKSIFAHAPNSKAAEAYASLAKEVVNNGYQRKQMEFIEKQLRSRAGTEEV